MKIKRITLILTLLLIFAWGFMLIAKGLFYTLSLAFYVYACNKLYKPIKSYLPIILETIKEDVPFGWYNFFENFRLWQKLVTEKNIQLINFWKNYFWSYLNFYKE